MNWLSLVIGDAFWSAIAAAGFAVMFNVPRRTLWGCALAGAAGHAVRTLLIQAMGLPVEVATLLGATTVGFLGVWLAHYLKAPSLIFSVCGAIPMVPGQYAYSAMLGLIDLSIASSNADTQILLDVSINAVRTGLILGAIALGIIMPKLLFRRAKPIV